MVNESLKQRPDGLTVISIWFYLCGAFFLVLTATVAFFTVIMGVGAVADDFGLIVPAAIFGIVALAFMVLSVLSLAVGYGLWIQKSWARIGAIALSIVGLIFMPIGTVAGGLILWYLLQPQNAAAFERATASSAQL